MAYERGRHPNSLRNLKPNHGGQVLNPTGKNGVDRPYTDAIRRMAREPFPEVLRQAMNANFSKSLVRESGNTINADDIADLYPKGLTWSEANAIRLHLSAVLHSDISASVEVRESAEGRATTRIEFESQSDKLEELLHAFRRVAVMNVPKVVN